MRSTDKERTDRYDSGFQILECLPYWSDLFPNENRPYQFIARLMSEPPAPFGEDERTWVKDTVQDIAKARSIAAEHSHLHDGDDGGILLAAEYTMRALEGMVFNISSFESVNTLCRKAHEAAKRVPRFAFSG